MQMLLTKLHVYRNTEQITSNFLLATDNSSWYPRRYVYVFYRVYATLPSDGHSIFDRLQPTSPVAVGTEDRPEKDDDPILD